MRRREARLTLRLPDDPAGLTDGARRLLSLFRASPTSRPLWPGGVEHLGR